MPSTSSIERRIPSATGTSGPTPSEIRCRASRFTRPANSSYDRLVPAKVSAIASGVRATCVANIDGSVSARVPAALPSTSRSTS
ncbi:hypothetical protein NRB56_76230 [Nocardia sp. RB56]|uniref:Uncharacterized protein n=1 Tax=Nocardia aurantia TaxID=2585199 RepID=A0A7K0E1Q3_9NOCA|nr:hypothetical protein [Nocardia aurantia]